MRDIIFLSFYIAMLLLSLGEPAVAVLAYMMTDFVRPQYVAYGFLTSLPLSMIWAFISAIAWFFIKDKPARITLGIKLLVLWCIWMTITTFMAEVQNAAWLKWNWAFKGALFTVFLPYFFNTRPQIEAAILVLILSISAHIIPVGLKTIVSGGGYQLSYGLYSGNTGLAEGSTLAMIAASLIPLYLWAGRYSGLITSLWRKKEFSIGMSFLALAASLGTFARTGLVSVVVLALAFAFLVKRKIVYILLLLVMVFAIQMLMGDRWLDRMKTMQDVEQEGSAMGRVAVWLWTIDYAKAHPFGGGFDVYRINEFKLDTKTKGVTYQIEGKAFHSIYFEVLGEQGIPGFALFMSMIVWMLLTLKYVQSKSRESLELKWIGMLASSLIVTTLVYLAGGAFIGVAYQPYFWYLYAITIAMRHYIEKYTEVTRQQSRDLL